MELSIYNFISIGAGIFLLAMWIQFALFPDHNMKKYFNEEINTSSGRNQIRAMAGGTNLGLALILFFGAFKPEYQAIAFLTVGTIGISISCTRLAFLFKDKPHTFFNRFDATMESLGGLLLIYLGIHGL